MSYKRYTNLVEVCVCGHGKVHHNGHYAECTCDKGQYKNQKLCNCPDFKLDMKNPINERIIEWNNQLQSQDNVL